LFKTSACLPKVPLVILASKITITAKTAVTAKIGESKPYSIPEAVAKAETAEL